MMRSTRLLAHGFALLLLPHASLASQERRGEAGLILRDAIDWAGDSARLRNQAIALRGAHVLFVERSLRVC